VKPEVCGTEHGLATSWLRKLASTSDPGFASIFGMLPSSPIPFDPVIGERRFGPHQVVVKNFLRNIRITTFFAGESEVKIIDPSRISEVQGFGCKVEFIPPTESIL
jgi:hypothetical protein